MASAIGADRAALAVVEDRLGKAGAESFRPPSIKAANRRDFLGVRLLVSEQCGLDSWPKRFDSSGQGAGALWPIPVLAGII
jgi:hypothetical protein